MSAGSCGVCGGPTVATIAVESVGSGGPEERDGYACVEPDAESGRWILHVHEERGDLG